MITHLHRLFSLLAFISFLLVLVAIGKDAIHTNHLVAKRPQAPQPEFGRTIQFNAGRRTVYISREDHQRDHELEGYRIWSAVALCFFGLVSRAFEHSRRKASSPQSGGRCRERAMATSPDYPLHVSVRDDRPDLACD